MDEGSHRAIATGGGLPYRRRRGQRGGSQYIRDAVQQQIAKDIAETARIREEYGGYAQAIIVEDE